MGETKRFSPWSCSPLVNSSFQSIKSPAPAAKPAHLSSSYKWQNSEVGSRLTLRSFLWWVAHCTEWVWVCTKLLTAADIWITGELIRCDVTTRGICDKPQSGARQQQCQSLSWMSIEHLFVFLILKRRKLVTQEFKAEQCLCHYSDMKNKCNQLYGSLLDSMKNLY